ncbi:MAG: hypothetical protein JSU63_02665, partial [Phycisphaerales bacterium]
PRVALNPTPYATYALNSADGGLWAANGSDIYNTNSGEVGIGTTSPSYPLHVVSADADAVFGESSVSGRAGVYGKGSGFEGGGFGVRGDSYGPTGIGVFGIAAMTTGNNYGVYGQSQSQTGRGVYGLGNNAAGVNYGVYGKTNSPDGWAGYFDGRSYFGGDSYFDGNVGVNHSNPQQPLAIGGDPVTDEALGVGGTILISKSRTAPGPGLNVARRINDSLPSTYHRTEIDANSINTYERFGSTDSAVALELNNESSGNVLLAQGGGNVGIGTTLADGELGIGTASPQSLLHLSSLGGIDLIVEADTDDVGETQNARVVFKQDGGAVAGRVGYRHGTNKLEVMQEFGDSLVLGANNLDAITINDEGKVGIGHPYATYMLDVQEIGGEPLANFTQLGTGAGVRIAILSGRNPHSALTVVGLNAAPALQVLGTASVNVLQITGADVAEKFPVSEPVKPGMVVAIDPDHSGKLCLSRGAYNRRVAGVVSGANNLPAGAVLGNLPGQEAAPPVALTGRVWVHCDAAGRPIEPGDMLTTSGTPGHAMKVTDYSAAQGAIIGKAMTSLEDGRGLVLVLVSLQ